MRILAVAVVGCLGLAGLLPAGDAALGVWKFNHAVSTYESSPAPRESTRIWEKAGEGKVRFLHTTVSAQGRSGRTEFVAAYDGKPYPVTGSSRYDTVTLQLVNEHVVEQTFRLRGEVTVRARRTISADGKRMTIIATGNNPDGRAFRNVLVYDLQ